MLSSSRQCNGTPFLEARRRNRTSSSQTATPTHSSWALNTRRKIHRECACNGKAQQHGNQSQADQPPRSGQTVHQRTSDAGLQIREPSALLDLIPPSNSEPRYSTVTWLPARGPRIDAWADRRHPDGRTPQRLIEQGAKLDSQGDGEHATQTRRLGREETCFESSIVWMESA